METLRSSLLSHVKSIPGLLALALSDREGVSVLRVRRDDQADVDPLFSPVYLSSYSYASEASERIGLGENRMMLTCLDNDRLVASFEHKKLILTMVADEKRVIIASLKDLDKMLTPLVDDISKVVIRDH